MRRGEDWVRRTTFSRLPVPQARRVEAVCITWGERRVWRIAASSRIADWARTTMRFLLPELRCPVVQSTTAIGLSAWPGAPFYPTQCPAGQEVHHGRPAARG